MPMVMERKTLASMCNVRGCNLPHANVIVRIASSGKQWAFARMCEGHTASVLTLGEMVEAEKQLKGKNTGPTSLANFAIKKSFCPHCNRSLVDWTNTGETALPIGLYQDCNCRSEDKAAVVSKPKTTNVEKTTETNNNATAAAPAAATIVNETTNSEKGKVNMSNVHTPGNNRLSTFTGATKRQSSAAAKRVAAKQAVKVLRAAIVKGLEAQGSPHAMVIKEFLSTEYGEALIGAVAATGLQQFAVPGVSDNVRGAISEELMVGAMAEVGNKLISDLQGPMMAAIAELSGPMEQVRVALEHEQAEAAGNLSAPETQELEVETSQKAALKAGR